jgi:hypothetical protein
MSRITLLFGLGALVIGLGALATNAGGATGGGVITINQSKVPFVINASGSYRLTSDLVESDPTISPITVKVPGVTIELNGFSVVGGKTGIDASGAYLVTIQNGQVSGAKGSYPGGDGISTGHSSRIENVRVFGNAENGVHCTDGCEVSQCVVNNNGAVGILIVDSSFNGRAVVASNVVQYNGGEGIGMGLGGGLVTGNAINNNGLSSGRPGLLGQTGSACAYSNNVFNANGALPTGCFNLGQNACTGAACP